MAVLSARSKRGPASRRARRYASIGLLACIALFGAVAAYSADDLSPGEPRVSITPRTGRLNRGMRSSTLRLDVSLTLIPVSVTDEMDRPLTGLTKDAFRLFEENVEQKIVSFSSEEGPVSLALVFDTSGSMRTKIDKSLVAVHQFLNTTLPGDEFMLVRFSDVPELVTRFTTDSTQIDKDLSFVEPQGWTALNDAMYLAAQQMKSAKNSRKALLILSDGADNNSRYTEAEVRSRLMESDVRVYVIGISERPKFLKRMAEETGGRAFWVRKVDELPEAVEKLSTEFRSHYLLGYSSTNSQNDGKFRKVRVDVSPRSDLSGQLRVFWRRGYYTPGE